MAGLVQGVVAQKAQGIGQLRLKEEPLPGADEVALHGGKVLLHLFVVHHRAPEGEHGGNFIEKEDVRPLGPPQKGVVVAADSRLGLSLGQGVKHLVGKEVMGDKCGHERVPPRWAAACRGVFALPRRLALSPRAENRAALLRAVDYGTIIPKKGPPINPRGQKISKITNSFCWATSDRPALR